ncbi:MAG TPA: GatB/YqeY domain-containing protein [Thermoanaerobacterales bacterium]|uniref:GatB/YqeY domain-containing protein n=1 Tax=Tepidanaerobacter sp. GT38 TaxID=2722793 RepID=UPI001798E990|nr:GatB/YqeY domain-containing protein [Tepidanaerobacter sp. GT38]MCG1012709.1 GatB/YqeY domain-containing protein [Tepidanaerobacter sp. GT38]HHY42641.1 GatB/YqeY domain-containing protein [Thermoanaerobacterales bacterium]
MSIKDMLNQDMKAALKAGEKDRLSVIRMAKSAILYAEKEKLHELNDEEVIEVLAREVKKRKQNIEEYRRLGKEEVAKSLEQEVEILSGYLPQQLTKEELVQIVRETISEVGANSIKDMGKVMGAVMPKIKGRADGSLVSNLVKELLQ